MQLDASSAGNTISFPVPGRKLEILEVVAQELTESWYRMLNDGSESFEAVRAASPHRLWVAAGCQPTRPQGFHKASTKTLSRCGLPDRTASRLPQGFHKGSQSLRAASPHGLKASTKALSRCGLPARTASRLPEGSESPRAASPHGLKASTKTLSRCGLPARTASRLPQGLSVAAGCQPARPQGFHKGSESLRAASPHGDKASTKALSRCGLPAGTASRLPQRL